MAGIDVALGDAAFTVNASAQGWLPSNRWQDTAHFHADYEVHILLSGSALIEVEGKDVCLEAGELCLLAPNVSHYPQSGSGELKKVVFSFNLLQNNAASGKAKHFSEYVHYCNILQAMKSYFVVKDDALLAIVKSLLSQELTVETEHIYSHLFALFFISLTKRMQEQRLPEEDETVGEGSVGENTVNQRKIVEAFFQTRYHQNIRIGDLARELCLSVPQTHRVVKRIFNAGFQKTLMKQRMEHACMLIKQHSTSLEEVAYLCGYTSYNGFLSAFKSHTGKTPKEYEMALR